MATYTKETALYDTGKIGNDIASAGQTATSYLTTISGTSGISVHNANDTENFVNMNSEGVGIYQDGTNVAQFGATTRIGEENEASITISSDSISGLGEGGKEFFNFQNSSVTMSSSIQQAHFIRSLASSWPTTAATGRSARLNQSPSSGTKVSVQIEFSVGGTNTRKGTTFNRGTSATKSVSFTSGGMTCQVYATYDGDRNFTQMYIDGSVGSDWYINYVRFSFTLNTIAPCYEIGGNVEATGGYALAEGCGTTASGNYAHAEGQNTTASGNRSHAEGVGCVASAEGTHAGGYGTIASKDYQTVIGQDNVEDTDVEHAFIIGNGLNSEQRSNALTVDWDGNVDIASGAHYKINGANLSASDVGAVPTTTTVNGQALSANVADADYVTEEGSKASGSVTWTYRKWNSGKIEAWCGYTFASSASTVWTSPVRYWDKTVNIPSGIFSAAPRVMATSQSTQYWVGGCTASNATTASIRVLTAASGSMALNVNIYAIAG